MRSFVPMPSAPAASLSILNRLVGAIRQGIDTLFNRLFALTHHASTIRWNLLLVSFILSWFLGVILTVPQDVVRQQMWTVFEAVSTFPFVDGQALVLALFHLLLITLFHPAVIKHGLALFAPFWLMYRIAAIYLADVFEESDLNVARHFVIEAAFGRGYRTLHIRQGAVDEKDAKSSTIIKIGGPGYVQVDLYSAALFERPDGTPHVILPGQKQIIDDFERLRRVIDVRDSIETIDLPPTRTKDGIFVGAKNIQFSYSVYRGLNPNRAQNPYPCSASAIENLVYKDVRPVKSGVAPARVPEWQLGQFKMTGAIASEIGAFISRRGLSEFLAAIGEPEENMLLDREKEIIQNSQAFGGQNLAQPDKPPLEAPKNFSPRTALTEAFYSQDDFVKRMSQKGFQLNWVGVGTWYTPAEIILTNHREAWRISRENLARGSKAALQAVKNEASLQELLRLIQSPVRHFLKGVDLLHAGDEKPLDDILQDYEEIFLQAQELYRRGPDSLEARFRRLLAQTQHLVERLQQPAYSDYNNFLNLLNSLLSSRYSVYDSFIEEWLQPAAGLYEQLKSVLDTDDLQFLLDANKLYEELRNYNQIVRVASALNSARRFHWVQGPSA